MSCQRATGRRARVREKAHNLASSSSRRRLSSSSDMCPLDLRSGVRRLEGRDSRRGLQRLLRLLLRRDALFRVGVGAARVLRLGRGRRRVRRRHAAAAVNRNDGELRFAALRLDARVLFLQLHLLLLLLEELLLELLCATCVRRERSRTVNPGRRRLRDDRSYLFRRLFLLLRAAPPNGKGRWSQRGHL